jgi:hypothetical protein
MNHSHPGAGSQRLVSRRSRRPSQIADDPVLALTMGTADAYPHAEERRLLYVAMTRARRGVILIAPASGPSPFVAELVADDLVHHIASAAQAPQPCPLCGRGVLIQRKGRYGPSGDAAPSPGVGTPARRCRPSTPATSRPSHPIPEGQIILQGCGSCPARPVARGATGHFFCCQEAPTLLRSPRSPLRRQASDLPLPRDHTDQETRARYAVTIGLPIYVILMWSPDSASCSCEPSTTTLTRRTSDGMV